MSRYNGIRPVTNGLVFCVDAANPQSIVSGQTTWKDLTFNTTGGTLVNGVGFSGSGVSSGLVFDGTDDYVNLGSNSITNLTNNFTITVIFSTNDINQSNQTLFSKAEGGAYGLEFNTSLAVNSIGFIGYISGNYRTVLDPISGYTSNKVYSVSVTYDNNFLKLFRNGVKVNETSQTGNITTTTVPLSLGINPQASGPFIFPLNGNIHLFQIHNRVLSESEILQNFNALRGRFGI